MAGMYTKKDFAGLDVLHGSALLESQEVDVVGAVDG